MVVLNRIYTRSGDDGTTALGTGERRKKHDLRIEAYGTLDEVNAVIGVARCGACAHSERSVRRRGRSLHAIGRR
jgi:cob(I)alamin adenosyltransferase